MVEYISNPIFPMVVCLDGDGKLTNFLPEITQEERELMDETSPYPTTEKDKRLERMVEHYRRKLPDILVAPFNNNRWSII